MNTIAEEAARVATQIEALAVPEANVNALFEALAASKTADGTAIRYIFRDGSVLVYDFNSGEFGPGFKSPACFCLVKNGHTCGEDDLPAFDPDAEVDFEEEHLDPDAEELEP